MDLSLLITIALVFVVTLIGAYVRSTRRDVCLKSFVDFNITLERSDDRLIWGVLHLESTGMELSYLNTVQDEKHIESTYLLHAAEYGDIQAIYRYADMLSEWGQRQRAQDIQRSFHPSLPRKLGRQVRNFLSTATDSLNEVLNLVMGRVQKAGGRYLTDQGGAVLGKLGGKVLGQVGGGYDPLLERYIGQRVVIELLEGDEVHEHVGIFKNYSTDFLEVLDVQYPQPKTISLSSDGGFISPRVVAEAAEGVLRVTNNDSRPLLVHSLEDSAGEQLINAVVDCGETIVLHPNRPELAQARLHLRIVRELDMIVPRNRAVVRHRAERIRTESLSDAILDIVFDVGVSFTMDRSAGESAPQETRLRGELARDPRDAVAAANLGLLLLRRQAYTEAEKWLRQALSMEYSLPDGGRRARMELRELERRRRSEIELQTAADAGPTAPHI